MIHNCEICKNPIKEVGRLKKFYIRGTHYLFVCNKCYSKLDYARSIHTNKHTNNYVFN